MDLFARTVTAPDGETWTVSPRWRGVRARLRLPSAWRRRRSKKDREGDGSPWLEACDCGVADDLVSSIVVVIVVIIVGALAWFLIWPLLAIALELMVLLTLVFAASFARVVFRRPWIVEAHSSLGNELEYEVRGYGPMRRCLTELADQLAAGRVEPLMLGAEPIRDPDTVASAKRLSFGAHPGHRVRTSSARVRSRCLTAPPRIAAHHTEEMQHGNRNRQVVQRREGLWLHHSR